MRRTCLLMLLVFLTAIITTEVSADENYNCHDSIHKYEVTEKLATESESGYRRFVCELCGDKFEEILLPSTHQWEPWITDINATCTTNGLRHRDCRTGTPHSEHQIIQALGHDYAVTIKNPTCTEKGTKTQACNRCGDTVTESYGESTGHEYKETFSKERNINTVTFACTHCNDTYSETADHTHEYVITHEVKPSCENEGIITYECMLCDSTYGETSPSLGHNYGEWTVIKRPNLTEEGKRQRICSHDNSHIDTEKMPKAVTMEVTPATVAAGSVSLAIIAISILFLISDIKIFRWYKRNCERKWKEIRERRDYK